MKVRVRFAKYGTTRFLGHLDVMRYFQKALRRTDTPCSYTDGFSPHMIMSFAEPLGLGVTSSGEYFDMELDYKDPFLDPDAAPVDGRTGADPSTFDEPRSSAELLASWNSVMTEGFEILSIRRIDPGRKGNAMSITTAASYEITLQEDPVKMQSLCEALLARESILAVKETKTGTKEMDIRPLIYELSAQPSGEPGETVLKLFSSGGSAANLKPDLVMRALFGSQDGTGVPAYRLHRTDMFTTGEDGKFLSLGLTGEEIP